MPETFKRFNTRIREDQQKFIKSKGKKEKRTEGDILREIIDEYINNRIAQKNG